MLSFSDPQMLPLVYHKDVDKNEFWTPGALGEHPPLLQTLDHKEHAKKRKVIAPIVRSIFQLRRLLYANSNKFAKAFYEKSASAGTKD